MSERLHVRVNLGDKVLLSEHEVELAFVVSQPAAELLRGISAKRYTMAVVWEKGGRLERSLDRWWWLLCEVSLNDPVRTIVRLLHW